MEHLHMVLLQKDLQEIPQEAQQVEEVVFVIIS
jgi:hypothetical protein